MLWRAQEQPFGLQGSLRRTVSSQTYGVRLNQDENNNEITIIERKRMNSAKSSPTLLHNYACIQAADRDSSRRKVLTGRTDPTDPQALADMK